LHSPKAKNIPRTFYKIKELSGFFEKLNYRFFEAGAEPFGFADYLISSCEHFSATTYMKGFSSLVMQRLLLLPNFSLQKGTVGSYSSMCFIDKLFSSYNLHNSNFLILDLPVKNYAYVTKDRIRKHYKSSSTALIDFENTYDLPYGCVKLVNYLVSLFSSIVSLLPLNHSILFKFTRVCTVGQVNVIIRSIAWFEKAYVIRLKTSKTLSQEFYVICIRKQAKDTQTKTFVFDNESEVKIFEEHKLHYDTVLSFFYLFLNVMQYRINCSLARILRDGDSYRLGNCKALLQNRSYLKSFKFINEWG